VETFLFKQGDALLIVDVQVDFCPGGSLPIPGGDEVVPVINSMIHQARERDILVIYSRDFHPTLHPSFKENGGIWPVHCVQDTPGAQFHPELVILPDPVVVSKGTRFDKEQYSAFDETGLDALLRREGIKRVWVVGLALDVCVKETALDAKEKGFDVVVYLPGCRAVTPGGRKESLSIMKEKGIEIQG